MIYILYSTDYELFLGANYAAESEVLIEPTNELLEVCKSLGVPLNIFCDVACLWRYRELGENVFPDQAEAQLRNALKGGHDVQTHLHPHWLNAERNGNQWVYPEESFLLGNHSNPGELLKRARDYLQVLLKPVNPNYRCIAYRAGGFGLQPNEKAVLAGLESAGYLIDSSIVPGMVMESNVNRIDFSRVPREPYYRISSQTGLNHAAKQGLIEIPVAAADLGVKSLGLQIAEKIAVRVARETHPWVSRGRSVQEQGTKPSLSRKIEKLTKRWFPLELRFRPQLMLELTRKYLGDLESRHPGKDIYFSLLSHTKTLSPSMLEAFRSYHLGLMSRYGTNIKAITYQQAANQLAGGAG